MSIKIGVKNRLNAYRNPVYLLYSLFGLFLFIIFGFVANSGVGRVELALFDVFNGMSDAFYAPMLLITFLCTIIAAPVIALIALFRKHYANSVKIITGTSLVLILTEYINSLNIRSPQDVALININHRGLADSVITYPSPFMAIAAILALTCYIYLPKRLHRIVTGLVILVAVSQMYLGLSFPTDLLGGFGLGLFVGGLLNFLLGSRRYNPVPANNVKKSFQGLGFNVSSAKLAAVDARGSIPYVLSGSDTNYFVKVVGFENNVADWLFKLIRKIMYKRLEDEQPYLSPKRQLEHEAYVAMLALQSGVRSPKIVGIFEAAPGRWAMAQEMIPGKSLDRVDPKLITDKILDGVWGQIKILHDHKIIHRDLRAANIFLDNNNQAWLIDFGFSEGSVSEEKFYRDTVELIASLSLLVDYKRVIKSAKKVIGTKELIGCMPYLEYACLSGATTTGLKKQKSLLAKIRKELSTVTGFKNVKLVKLKRFDLKFFLILISLGIAINVLAPQLVDFQDAIKSANNASLPYIIVGVILSMFTYILAGFSYKFIAIYPLRLWPTVIVQIASSFASKLAPAGTGGMALNARYLYKNNHDPVQSGAVTTINTLLGLVAHVSVVLFVSLLTKGSVLDLLPDIHVPAFVLIVIALSLITLAISIKVFPNFNKIFIKGRDKLIDQIKHYRENYLKLVLGYLVSVSITLTFTAILYICCLAFGVNLTVLDVVYVFTVGTLVATVTPTPGGIGGAEAAFIASLTSVGVEGSVAVAITLLYRLLTFWLPILPGFIAFKHATAKEYI